MPRVIPFLAALILYASSALAQAGEGPYARITVIRPLPGRDSAFQAGYRRHLDWHRQNKDPWYWYGWWVVMGPRLGWFVDGTFGRSATSLDSAVAPAADAADNARNVSPHGEWMSSAVHEFLPRLSSAPASPPRSRLMEWLTIEVAPGDAARFEAAVAAAGKQPDVGWYRLVTGGRVATYLRMRAFDTPSAAVATSAIPPEALSMVRKLDSELLRWDRGMSTE